ncbi:biopolymer transporter ExbD [bacterium]|jgi:biopolymer transport protein ExbD|nr:biopolymer transporter ExbD [bacterium]
MFANHRKKRSAKLSIAPLLDMIFILLIFFVVSTTFSKLPGVKINKPEARHVESLSPNNILIGVTEDGRYFINETMYSLDELNKKVALKFSMNPKLSVVIVADKLSKLKYTIAIMDMSKDIGILDISIAEEKIK